VGLIYNNPGYHARDYEEDHDDQEDDAERPLRSMKRLACRDFNAMRDIDRLRWSRGNCNSAVRSPTRFGNGYTILYIYGSFALSCPEGPAVSTCESKFSFGCEIQLSEISPYQPHERHEASSHIATLGDALRHCLNHHTDKPFQFEGSAGMGKSFCIALTKWLKKSRRAEASHSSLELRRKAQACNTRLTGAQLSLGTRISQRHGLHQSY
jgi:hypothetical protein